MIDALVHREFRDLPLGLLDRPEVDARIDRSPEFLDALARDIQHRGVLVPIIVVRVGERYEVVDGFTRYIVANRIGLVTVPCCIYAAKDLALEGVKYAATQFHENFSPADEAIYFKQLLDVECAGDIEKLCALVNKKLSYVDNRLGLINGCSEVFDALRAKTISIGVAQELNKISADDYRSYYLKFAMRDGATVSTVSGWVAEWRKMHELTNGAPAAPAIEAAQQIANTYDPHRCAICQKSDPRFIPESLPVHTHCRLAVLEPMLSAYRGEQ